MGSDVASDTPTGMWRKPRGSSWQGPMEVLEEVIIEFARKGPSIVRYEEKLEGKLDQSKLIAHAPFLNKLRSINPSLLFSFSMLRQCLLNVHDTLKWDMGGQSVKEDWAATIANRIKTMCRHILQSEYRTPNAAWLSAFAEHRPAAASPAGRSMESLLEASAAEVAEPQPIVVAEPQPIAQAPPVVPVEEYHELEGPGESMGEFLRRAFRRQVDQCEQRLVDKRRQFLEALAAAGDPWEAWICAAN
jgi:hypothetical protein